MFKCKLHQNILVRGPNYCSLNIKLLPPEYASLTLVQILFELSPPFPCQKYTVLTRRTHLMKLLLSHKSVNVSTTFDVSREWYEAMIFASGEGSTHGTHVSVSDTERNQHKFSAWITYLYLDPLPPLLSQVIILASNSNKLIFLFKGFGKNIMNWQWVYATDLVFCVWKSMLISASVSCSICSFNFSESWKPDHF